MFIFADTQDPPLSWTIFNETHRHAEQIFMDDYLKKYLGKTSSNNQLDCTIPGQLNGYRIVLYMNFSPCSNCAQKLYHLAINNPLLDLHIKIIKVYKYYDSKTAAFLRLLLRTRENVSLAVQTTTVEEYGGLYKRTVPVDEETQKILDELRERNATPVKTRFVPIIGGQSYNNDVSTGGHVKRKLDESWSCPQSSVSLANEKILKRGGREVYWLRE